MSARAVRIARAGACALVLLAGTAVLSRASIVRATSEIANPLDARQSWVADEARLLTEGGIAAIDARVFALERVCGAQIAVVTVDTLDAAHTPKAFATALFGAWGIGKRGRDDGVLVLLTQEPRRIEVETGYGAESVLPDGEVGRLLDTHAMPRLRERDFDGALLALVNAMADELQRTPVEGEGEPVRSTDPLRVLLGLVAAALTSFGSLFAFLRWRGFHKRCPNCRRAMRFVPADRESAFLSSEEVLEEALKSMDHRVFRCDPCDLTLVDHHRRWFTSYSDCPKCRRRTLGYKSHVLVSATRYREGKREVTRRCARPGCGHVSVTVETIPRIVESSSSSGSSSSGGSSSSFGGGSSGGGGAGRSW